MGLWNRLKEARDAVRELENDPETDLVMRENALLLASMCCWIKESATPVDNDILGTILLRLTVTDRGSDEAAIYQKIFAARAIEDWRKRNWMNGEDPFIYRVDLSPVGVTRIITLRRTTGKLDAWILPDSEVDELVSNAGLVEFIPSYDGRLATKIFQRRMSTWLQPFATDCPGLFSAWRAGAADMDTRSGILYQEHLEAARATNQLGNSPP